MRAFTTLTTAIGGVCVGKTRREFIFAVYDLYMKLDEIKLFDTFIGLTSLLLLVLLGFGKKRCGHNAFDRCSTRRA